MSETLTNVPKSMFWNIDWGGKRKEELKADIIEQWVWCVGLASSSFLHIIRT